MHLNLNQSSTANHVPLRCTTVTNHLTVCFAITPGRSWFIWHNVKELALPFRLVNFNTEDGQTAAESGTIYVRCV